MATNAIGAAVGTPLLVLTSWLAGETWTLPPSATTWLTVAYLVASTCIGFVVIVFLILRWSPSAAAYGAVLSTVVAVILATTLAGETFGPGFFIGAVVVGVGVYLGALASSRRPAPRPAGVSPAG